MEDLDADFQNHGLDILEIIIDKLRNAESNRCCLGILLKRMETLKIVLDGPGRKVKIDSFANIYTLIQSAEVISNLYCYHVSKTYYQHPVKAGKAREEIQHLVEHIGISLQETSLDNFAQVAPMQEYSLLFDTAELNDNSATVLALQGMPELEDTDMLDAVVDEFRARNSLLAAGGRASSSLGTGLEMASRVRLGRAGWRMACTAWRRESKCAHRRPPRHRDAPPRHRSVQPPHRSVPPRTTPRLPLPARPATPRLGRQR